MEYYLATLKHDEDLIGSTHGRLEMLKCLSDYKLYCRKYKSLIDSSDWSEWYIPYLFKIDADSVEEAINNFNRGIKTKLIERGLT